MPPDQCPLRPGEGGAKRSNSALSDREKVARSAPTVPSPTGRGWREAPGEGRISTSGGANQRPRYVRRVHEHSDVGTQRARELRKQSTRAERIVWRWFRDRRFGGWKFRRQYPIGPFIADFYCDALKLVVEIDGSGHLWRWYYDEARMKYLRHVGIAVVRISNVQVCREPDAAADTIISAILSRLPLTWPFGPPSPEGEG